MKISLFYNGSIYNYNIVFNRTKISNIKKKLEEYSTLRIIEVDFDLNNENLEEAILRKSPNDKFICMVNTKNQSNNPVYFDNSDYSTIIIPPRFRRMNKIYDSQCCIKQLVKVESFPILYRLLFTNHFILDNNIINTIKGYLLNERIGKDSDFHSLDNLYELLHSERKTMEYDYNIPKEIKASIIREFFYSMEISLESSESFKSINSQMQLISNLNASTEKIALLNKLEKKINDAKETMNDLNLITSIVTLKDNLFEL